MHSDSFDKQSKGRAKDQIIKKLLSFDSPPPWRPEFDTRQQK